LIQNLIDPRGLGGSGSQPEKQGGNKNKRFWAQLGHIDDPNECRWKFVVDSAGLADVLRAWPLPKPRSA